MVILQRCYFIVWPVTATAARPGEFLLTGRQESTRRAGYGRGRGGEGGKGRGSSNRCVYLNGVGSICQQVHYIAIGSVDGRPVVLLKEDATDILQTSIRNKRIHFIEFQHRIRDTDETEKGDNTGWCIGGQKYTRLDNVVLEITGDCLNTWK